MEDPPELDEFTELEDTDDYYSWLGLSSDASKEDIKKAFQKYSLIYHPDKHSTNPESTDKSRLLFEHIRTAYDVLSDDHKKAIYDTMGIKGLEADGWELVNRTKTPAEIVEEYDRMEKERQERKLMQRTNPKGTMRMGVDLTDLFNHYESEQDLEYGPRDWPQIEISQMAISQSVEMPLTTHDTASISGSLQSHNGNGNGTLTGSLRRIISSKSWAEVEMSVGGDTLLQLRGFRSLWQRAYCTMTGMLQFTPQGIQPGISTTLAQQLDENLQGRISWNAGIHSNISTTVMYQTERHLVSSSIQIGLQTSFAMVSYSCKFPSYDAKLKTSMRLGTFGGLFEYGCDKKVSSFSNLGATMVIGSSTGVRLKIKLLRGQQNYVFPLFLSSEVDPSAIFYGTTIPMLMYIVGKVFFINPYVRASEIRELHKKKEANKKRTEDKRREAIAALDLMKQSIDRCYVREREICGLVITKALFGKLHHDNAEESTMRSENTKNEYIHVTRQLQHKVDNSRMTIEKDIEMSGLPGFYDPCIGEEKQLSIDYTFHNKNHHHIFNNKEKVLLPSQKHKVKT